MGSPLEPFLFMSLARPGPAYETAPDKSGLKVLFATRKIHAAQTGSRAGCKKFNFYASSLAEKLKFP